MEDKKEKLAKEAYVMFHPLRRKIVKLLAKGEPMYVAKIAKELGITDKAKLIGFHLAALGEHKLVEGSYGIRHGPPTDESGRPVIVNYYKLTAKAEEIIKTFNL